MARGCVSRPAPTDRPRRRAAARTRAASAAWRDRPRADPGARARRPRRSPCARAPKSPRDGSPDAPPSRSGSCLRGTSLVEPPATSRSPNPRPPRRVPDACGAGAGHPAANRPATREPARARSHPRTRDGSAPRWRRLARSSRPDEKPRTAHPGGRACSRSRPPVPRVRAGPPVSAVHDTAGGHRCRIDPLRPSLRPGRCSPADSESAGTSRSAP